MLESTTPTKLSAIEISMQIRSAIAKFQSLSARSGSRNAARQKENNPSAAPLMTNEARDIAGLTAS
jgi:hypothetical protein